MSTQNDVDPTFNSGYGSSDETASLLVISSKNHTANTGSISTPKIKMASHNSFNGPINTSTSSSCSSSHTNNNSQKPILMRQDRTSTYSESPQLSKIGGSEESRGELFPFFRKKNAILLLFKTKNKLTL